MRLPPATTRRAFLRAGAGALALPLLPSLASARSASASSRRLAIVYLPNGLHMPDWRPREVGPLGSELPATLQVLGRHREHATVLSGLTLDKARANGDGPGDHARAAAAFLTCAQPVKADGSIVEVGRSADQHVADGIGQDTRFASLQLGCDAGMQSGQCDSGYPCVYSSNLAWSSPHTPLTHESHPRRLFDRLFGVGLAHLSPEERARRVRTKRSVLDFVTREARDLSTKLSLRDRRKLEQYLEGVRALERRIDAATDPAAIALERPSGRPDDFAEHAELLIELLVLAFASDATRVGTFLMANEGSNRTYRSLDVSEGHHSLSHHGKDPQKQAQIARINRFHLGLFVRFLDRLADEELLADTQVVLGSGIADGNSHVHHDLPLLLCGASGLAPAGQHVLLPDETPLANLWLSVIQSFGGDLERFGDSTGTLTLL